MIAPGGEHLYSSEVTQVRAGPAQGWHHPTSVINQDAPQTYPQANPMEAFPHDSFSSDELNFCQVDINKVANILASAFERLNLNTNKSIKFY